MKSDYDKVRADDNLWAPRHQYFNSNAFVVLKSMMANENVSVMWTQGTCDSSIK